MKERGQQRTGRGRSWTKRIAFGVALVVIALGVVTRPAPWDVITVSGQQTSVAGVGSGSRWEIGRGSIRTGGSGQDGETDSSAEREATLSRPERFVVETLVSAHTIEHFFLGDRARCSDSGYRSVEVSGLIDRRTSYDNCGQPTLVTDLLFETVGRLSG